MRIGWTIEQAGNGYAFDLEEEGDYFSSKDEIIHLLQKKYLKQINSLGLFRVEDLFVKKLFVVSCVQLN